MARSVLLLEDDPVLGPSLSQRLMLEGFSVVHAATLQEARQALSRLSPDFVISDIRLPDGSGEALMEDLSERLGSVPVIFMTAYGNLDQAVRLVRAGARDYIAKPFDTDALMARIHALIDTQGGDSAATFGLSPPMAELRAMLDRLAKVDLPILVTGETGSGKEIAARYLHGAGERGDEPFEAVNCAQIAPDLADSLLFGHERGAFTGAHDRRIGVFEAVGRGTLLLDEIGDMPMELQLKLLRVLQDRTFRRVGGRSDITFSGRIVCATTRNLDEAVRSGAFREDLLFRINVVTLKVPPLRERRAELDALIDHFVSTASDTMNVARKTVSPEVYQAAAAHDWPGNVRELRNRIERAVALSLGPVISRDDVFPGLASPPRGQGSPASGATGRFETLEEARLRAERDHILHVLNELNWQMR